MLNFFKNKINKQIINYPLVTSKTLNNLLAINKQNFITINNNHFTNNNLIKNIDRKLSFKNNLLKIHLKDFNSDSSNKDNKSEKGSTERRRLGKQKESTEEALKKKLESLKIAEKQKEEAELLQKQKEKQIEDLKNTISEANQKSNNLNILTKVYFLIIKNN